jgi:antitoxin component YwqK of YwqJK toxin-antitoxin module
MIYHHRTIKCLLIWNFISLASDSTSQVLSEFFSDSVNKSSIEKTGEIMNYYYTRNYIDSSTYVYMCFKDSVLLSEGAYIEGTPIGCHHYYYESGSKMYSKNYKNGCGVGTLINWHSNGIIESYGNLVCISSDTTILDSSFVQNFQTGDLELVVRRSNSLSKEHGLWLYYNKDGKLIHTRYWQFGELKNEVSFE